MVAAAVGGGEESPRSAACARLAPQLAPLPKSVVALVGPEAEEHTDHASEQGVRERRERGDLGHLDVEHRDEERPQ